MKWSLSIFFLHFNFGILSQEFPKNVKKIIKHYSQVIDYKAGKIIFIDGSSMIYDDGKKKKFQELLDNPDVQDQFTFNYYTKKNGVKTKRNVDPGRIRNIDFFKKIYGFTKIEVEKNLVEINWCPILVNQKIKVTTINGFDKILVELSNELDKHPEFKPYLTNIAGTFDWRNIAGTNRLSMHSFGMTIDINVAKTNYWQWDCKCNNENMILNYQNKIPLGLVEIFEKYGFIWGGKWYHYDTMHFEYRPELVF